MEVWQKNFLEILNSAVHHLPVRLEEPADYGKILEIAREQNLLALVCEKLCECESFLRDPVYGEAVRETVGAVACQAGKTELFLDLYKKFEEAGICPIVVKGIVCRELYGKFRDHRPSGDEDLLIRKEDFSSIRAVMESKGFIMERRDVTAQELRALQEITFEDGQGELHIEVHTNPMGQETGIRRQMNRYFTEVFQKKISVQIENTEIWKMESTDHLLFLILHAFKHFMAGGLGIRQALDICLFCKRYQEEINWEYISDSLENVEGEKFFTDMLYIGNKYLGFDFKIHRERNCPDDLLEDMLTGGVFGNTTQTERTACSMTFAAVDSREKYSTASAVVRAIFPTMRFMRERNPELVEKPWLLPIFWMKRWGRFIRYDKENGGGLARESIRTSQKRIELLKKYGLI